MVEPILEAITLLPPAVCGLEFWFWKAFSNLILSMFYWFSISFLTFWYLWRSLLCSVSRSFNLSFKFASNFFLRAFISFYCFWMSFASWAIIFLDLSFMYLSRSSASNSWHLIWIWCASWYFFCLAKLSWIFYMFRSSELNLKVSGSLSPRIYLLLSISAVCLASSSLRACASSFYVWRRSSSHCWLNSWYCLICACSHSSRYCVWLKMSSW
jgi:hypothetical protein